MKYTVKKKEGVYKSLMSEEISELEIELESSVSDESLKVKRNQGPLLERY